MRHRIRARALSAAAAAMLVRAPGPARRDRTRGHRGPLLQTLVRRTDWVEDELLGLHHVVRPGDVCIDVGAYYGLYTSVLARLAGPSGAVHSVEPLSAGDPFLALVARRAPRGTVRRHRVALGDRASVGTMSVPHRRGLASAWHRGVGEVLAGLVSLSLPRGLPVPGRAFLVGASGPGADREFPGWSTVGVEVVTLDELCASEGLTRVDFVKIDVEGGELRVLQGAGGVLATQRPALLVEIETRHLGKYGHEPEDVAAWLTTHGYGMYAFDGTGWNPCSALSEAVRNYLFLPEATRSASAPSPVS